MHVPRVCLLHPHAYAYEYTDPNRNADTDFDRFINSDTYTNESAKRLSQYGRVRADRLLP
jgi:hypothetical protein